MSKRSIYESLKNFILYRNIPYHHFEDSHYTIAFTSWADFDPFDTALDSLSVANEYKISIYAEKVDGRSDGVAVTVSEAQILGYWDMYHNMKAIVAAFESMISIILQSGVHLLDFDYESLYVAVGQKDYENLPLIDIPIFVGKWRGHDGREGKEIHLDLNAF